MCVCVLNLLSFKLKWLMDKSQKVKQKCNEITINSNTDSVNFQPVWQERSQEHRNAVAAQLGDPNIKSSNSHFPI